MENVFEPVGGYTARVFVPVSTHTTRIFEPISGAVAQHMAAPATSDGTKLKDGLQMASTLLNIFNGVIGAYKWINGDPSGVHHFVKAVSGSDGGDVGS